MKKIKKTWLNSRVPPPSWVGYTFFFLLLYGFPIVLLLKGDDSWSLVFILLSIIYFFVYLYVKNDQKKKKKLIEEVGEVKYKKINNDLTIIRMIEQEILQITSGKYARMHLTPPSIYYTGKVKEFWDEDKKQIRYELSFKEGQEDGKWRGWHTNGTLGYEGEYKSLGFLGLGKNMGLLKFGIKVVNCLPLYNIVKAN